MNNICIYCNEPINDKEFISLGKKCAHEKCFNAYIVNLDELTEVMDLDGGDYYATRTFFNYKDKILR